MPDEGTTYPLTRILKSGKLSAELTNPANWPEAARLEYGEDEGLSASIKHRERLVQGFRQQRAALDAFNPDIVLIWGDDQYENFKEDIIPPFCVLAYDEVNAGHSSTATEAPRPMPGESPSTRCSNTRFPPPPASWWSN